MVSEVNQNGSEPREQRVRRSHGSCDVCKRRKIRCDRQIQGNRCTHCKSMGLDCTNSDLMKILPSESANGYVSALETRVEKMERLLTQENFTEQLGNEDQVEPLSLPQQHAELPRNDENIPSESFRKLKLHPANNRFFGKSSGVQLLQTALNFRKQLTGVGLREIKQHAAHNQSALAQKHKKLWSAASFLLPPPTDDWIPQYTFPDSDLLTTLVNLYFQEVNLYWPVLHRPTFNQKVAEKLHLRDHMFGSTVLMVCSLGARYSDDPRVLDDVETHQYRYDPLHSAGWKWHSQVRVIPEYLVYKPELYELQTIALSALYIQSSSTAWHQIGLGLRRAQDVGAHRRRSQPHPTAEDEQWKRVFWVLLCLEWVTGALTGRPLTMHNRDFDQDLPAECDDEFWDEDFQQPKDRPSYLSYFICYARLLEIQAAVTTTIYSARKPKDLGSPTPPTDAESIVAFDSALNSWLNNVPEHLRWDPARKNTLHLTQSARLHAAYYNVQILVHRPFIPFPFETPRPGALPSLAICTNAARSCVRILDIQSERGISVKVDMLHAVFASALVLFLHGWSDKKSCFASKDIEHIHTCLKIMTAAEKRYLVAGRYTDIMSRLLYAGESLEVLFEVKSKCTATPSVQRSRDADLASPWSSAFLPHNVDEFADELHAMLNSTLEPEGHENGFAMFPGDGSYTNPDPIYDFEQLVNMDLPQFSADMATWPTAPDLDVWSQDEPQIRQFSSGPISTYKLDPEEREKLCRELFGFWG